VAQDVSEDLIRVRPDRHPDYEMIRRGIGAVTCLHVPFSERWALRKDDEDVLRVALDHIKDLVLERILQLIVENIAV